jgi:alkylhydroperoxidase family enzyme
MTIDYANARYAPPASLVAAHSDAWTRIGRAGAFWSGTQRAALVAESRAALRCSLCERRQAALSPFSIDGRHDGASGHLPSTAVELAHRLTSDPGRLTRRWFDRLRAAGLDAGAYVEAVSVIASGVVIDTLHRALGVELAPLPEDQSDGPNGVSNLLARDEGAWVPIAPRDSDAPTATRLPAVPNIARALSLVPDAVSLFFRTFTPQYQLTGGNFAISRSEVEFVAARVSALNQCFY